MKDVALELLTSKKFLAMAAAIVIYVAGRFGWNVDPATLDHVFGALLVYVGGQGLADIGKGAAVIHGETAVKVATMQSAQPPVSGTIEGAS